MVSANVTSGGSLKKWLRQQDVVGEILCIQEHRTRDLDKIGLMHSLQALGWASAFGQAVQTECSTSGGVAILWRKWLSAGQPLQILEGRVICLPFFLPDIGQVYIYSIYGRSGEGLSKANILIFSKISWHCAGHGKPYIIAGDFNVQAQELSGWWRQMGWAGVFSLPKSTTCRSAQKHSIIDCFILHPSLDQLVGGTTVVEESCLATHLPVVLNLKRGGVEEEVELFQRWPELPTKPVIGPRGCFEGLWKIWVQQKELLKTKGKEGLERLFACWMTGANKEAADIVGATQTMGGEWTLGRKKLKCALATKHASRAYPSMAANLICRRLGEFLHLVKAKRGGQEIRGVGQGFCHQTFSKFVSFHFKFHEEGKYIMKGYRLCGQLVSSMCLDLCPASCWNSVTELLLSWVRVCKALAEQLQKVEWKQDGLEWQEWQELTLSKGASLANKWSRKVEEPKEAGTLSEAGFTTSPMQVMKAQWEKWAKLWGHKMQQGQGAWARMEPMAPIEVKDIRAAAKSFRQGTCAIDGWHPRVFGLLSESCLEALAGLFGEMETWGWWPATEQSLMVMLIGKLDGDLRPILLFRGLFRLWSRIRQGLVRRWQQEKCADHFLGNMAGRMAGDAVFRACVRAALAQQQDMVGYELLLDISKCFDRVKPEYLCKHAEDMGYPGQILRLSLLSYSWPRRLISGAGLVTAQIEPSIGIGPGSCYAIFELGMLLAPVIRRILLCCPAACLSIHVDDISAQVWAETEALAADALEEVAALLTREVEWGLELPFSKTKTVLMGTHKEGLEKLSKRLGLEEGQSSSRTRRLGFDYSIQPKDRGHQVCFARWRKGKMRMRRVRRGLGRKAGAKVFFQGVRPSVEFGAELGAAPKAQGMDVNPGAQGSRWLCPWCQQRIAMGYAEPC